MTARRIQTLLHPVRMRVALALSQEELSVKQLARLLDDVPQASLYRAVTELHEAGLITVMREERRGGATERFFRAERGEDLLSRQDIGALSGPEFVAGIEAYSRMLAQDATCYITSKGASWVDDFTIVSREVAHLTDEERQEIEGQLRSIIERVQASRPRPGTTATVLNITAFPHTVKAEDGA